MWFLEMKGVNRSVTKITIGEISLVEAVGTESCGHQTQGGKTGMITW